MLLKFLKILSPKNINKYKLYGSLCTLSKLFFNKKRSKKQLTTFAIVNICLKKENNTKYRMHLLHIQGQPQKTWKNIELYLLLR